ncbi:MAG: hypothetical protein AAB395_03940 [Patescibacteria group bacterium]
MDTLPDTIEMRRVVEPGSTLGATATELLVERPGQMSLEELDTDHNQTTLDI